MKIGIFIISGICLLLLESSVLSWFSIELFKPDFSIPFILYMSLFMEPLQGLLGAFFLGLFQEGVSGSPHGSIIFTKLSVFLLAMFIKGKVYIDSKFYFSYICGCFSLFESTLYLFLFFLSKGETGNALNILFYAIPNGVFTGFFSIFIFSLLTYMNSKILLKG
ncbi:MAG: hypothetical protein N2745_10875 [Syntrophorhabdaceae bacterium]|nr:hypothetical protein [Syntrophorhabdaceae bacterium]